MLFEIFFSFCREFQKSTVMNCIPAKWETHFQSTPSKKPVKQLFGSSYFFFLVNSNSLKSFQLYAFIVDCFVVAYKNHYENLSEMHEHRHTHTKYISLLKSQQNENCHTLLMRCIHSTHRFCACFPKKGHNKTAHWHIACVIDWLPLNAKKSESHKSVFFSADVAFLQTTNFNVSLYFCADILILFGIYINSPNKIDARVCVFGIILSVHKCTVDSVAFACVCYVQQAIHLYKSAFTNKRCDEKRQMM